MAEVAREQGGARDVGPTPEQIARRTLERMRGGDLFDVSPERSERIIAEELRDAYRAGFIRARDAAAEHASFVDDEEGPGSIESIIRAMDPDKVGKPAEPSAQTRGIMTVDMGASETAGHVAKIEAPTGCVFAKADGTPYAVGDVLAIGDPVSYSGPLDVIKVGGSIVMKGLRS